MENKYYIYAHTIATHGENRPFGEVFYIGKGFGYRAKSKYGRNTHWKNIVNKYGFNVHYFETELTEEQSFDAEKRYIKSIGREDLGLGTLCNFTDGGEGSGGHKWSDERKKNHILLMKGHICSEETKNKMREKRKSQIFSDETKNKMSNSGKIKIFSKEHKEKISKSLKGHTSWSKGKKLSNNTVLKIINSLTGRKHSDETKLKMSKSQIGNKNGLKNKKQNG